MSVEECPQSNPTSINRTNTKEDRLLHAVGVYIEVNWLVNIDIDEFSEVVDQPWFSPEQVKVCKDIRRRGKNKVAAANCRARKRAQVSALKEDVADLKLRRRQLEYEKSRLNNELQEMKEIVRSVETDIILGLNLDPDLFSVALEGEEVKIFAREYEPPLDLSLKNQFPPHHSCS